MATTTLRVGAFKKIVHREGLQGIISEGLYEWHSWTKKTPGQGYWQLTHWRVDAGTGHGFGEWYKVHGNQKRDCAGFKVVLDA